MRSLSLWFLICATVSVVLMPGAGMLFASLTGSPHDFSGAGWSKGEVCLPCHVSHRGESSGLVWNHSLPDNTDFDVRPGASLGKQSLMCLGCHDGQTALDSYGGDIGTEMMSGRAVVGRDLSNDHPVGVRYPDSDRRYESTSAVEQRLRLVDGRVECSSCHDPHRNDRGHFLRVESRQLCQTCHRL